MGCGILSKVTCRQCRTCSYDTICHEHLEYYSLGNVEHILRETGFRILDIEMNSINGGSFAITCRDDSSLKITVH